MTANKKGDIVIYKPKGGDIRLDVKLDKETVWLNLNQMAELFGRDKSVISRHLNNVFKTKELNRKSVVAKNATTASDGKTYQVDFYNLDAIISVGYKVNSKRGTQFRIWATDVLKDHLIKGYSVNEKRLQEQTERLQDLQKTADLMGRLLESKELDNRESAGLLRVITDYSYALTVLDDYDHQRLAVKGTIRKKEFVLKYEQARKAIDKLAEEFKRHGESVQLFGREKDESFQGLVGNLYQTFDGKAVYPSIEEKASHLLYFVVKNHSFVDGNKRIAAFLFVWFLEANGLLYRQDGSKRIGDNALVALTLMIAESKPKDKDLIVKVVVNLINRNN